LCALIFIGFQKILDLTLICEKIIRRILPAVVESPVVEPPVIEPQNAPNRRSKSFKTGKKSPENPEFINKLYQGNLRSRSKALEKL
jgi:hypothetical protein